MDALSCYFIGGTCAARTNLEVGLFRALGIPARVLIGTTMYYSGKKWSDAQHYLYEYYCPELGWIRGMSGRVPYEPKNCIVLKINYPEDENIAGGPFDFYGGCEPWFWIDDDNIILGFPDGVKYYKKRKGYGRPINRGWIENDFSISKAMTDKVLDVARDAWRLYIKYFWTEFKNSNKNYYNKGVIFQKKAINNLKNRDLNMFINNMQLAIKEYNKIK
jgi:hypothetical protein